MKFAKFLRTPFFKEHLRWLLLYFEESLRTTASMKNSSTAQMSCYLRTELTKNNCIGERSSSNYFTVGGVVCNKKSGIQSNLSLHQKVSFIKKMYLLKLRTRLMRYLILTRGIATVGARGPWSPPLQFPNQTRSKSLIRKHQGYCFLQMFRNYTDQKFHDLYCFNFWAIYSGFSFFLIA